MKIRVFPVNPQEHSIIGTESSEPYHIRVEVDDSKDQIRVPVFNTEEDRIMVVVINGSKPLLGHPKRDSCCG